MRVLDHWIGKTLFVPLVIWVCQRSGTSQWRFHAYAWMLGSWLELYAAGKKNMSAIGLHLALAFFFTFMAAKAPDRQTAPRLWLRLFFIFGESIHAGGHALFEAGLTSGGWLFWGVNWDASCVTGLLFIAAEYALTIKTIPPLESALPAHQKAAA